MDKLFSFFISTEKNYDEKRDMAEYTGVLFLTFALMSIHIIFLIYYFIIGVKIMVLINLFSITTYLVALLVNKKTTGQLSSLLITLEICTYCILCMFVLGWDSGTQWYLPTCITPCYILYPISKKRGQAYITIISLTALLCYLVEFFFLPYYDIDLGFVSSMNILVCMIGTIIVCKANEVGNMLTEIYYNEKIERLTSDANMDALTKLWNRRFGKKKLQELINAKDKRKYFCVAMVDIDFFKSINDTYGHNFGDKVLQIVSENITDRFRGTDIPIRWGGEEFLIILTNTSPKAAHESLESFRRMIENLTIANGDDIIKITITAGFSSYKQGVKLEDLLAESDRALYYGKNNGRNQVKCFQNI